MYKEAVFPVNHTIL